VFLKSLTLKGFKSFAEPTTLEFEPGVTVVVGPNGSGKSNIVDAVAWVLGAQGPRVVRSSRMDDVIFAGSPSRPALGRAEVSLTIDNSARRLPIDLAEVTVTRTLFRSGESEYAINGAPCRLLDVQELFSDSGVGRQQHVIVGQGQLDAILLARPEDRRMVVEEAAGVLKYRRRRERAARRLEASEADMVRLQDLLREVRRQLRPLERQAEAARRHDDLIAELVALRRHLAGRELAELARREGALAARAHALASEDAKARAALARLDEAVVAQERLLDAAPRSGAAPLLSRALQLLERVHGLVRLADERRRSLRAAVEARIDADLVASLEAEAVRLREEVAAAEAALASLVPEWEEVERRTSELAAGEAALGARSEEAELAARRAAEAAKSARVRVAEAVRRAGTLRERLARESERLLGLEQRRDEAAATEERRRAEAEGTRGALAAVREELATASARLAVAEQRRREAEERARACAEEAHLARARAAALRVALDEARARAGVELLAGEPGVLGTLLDVIEVDPGFEAAVEAALEESLAAVVVSDRDAAWRCLARLQAGGGAGTVLPVPARTARPALVHELPAGAAFLRRRVRARAAGLDVLLDVLLEGVAVVDGRLEDAEALPGAGVSLTVVTTAGDRLSPRYWRAGAGRAGVTRAALEAAEEEAARRLEEAGTARAAAAQATAEAEAAAAETAAVERRLDASSAELARAEADLVATAARRRELESAIDAERAALEALAAEVGAAEVDREAAEKAATAAEGDAAVAEQRAAAARDARRALEERARALAVVRGELDVRAASLAERRATRVARLEEVERRLAGHAAARGEAERRRAELERSLVVLERLAGVLDGLRGRLSGVVERLRVAEEAERLGRAAVLGSLEALRRDRHEAEQALVRARELAARVEVERAEVQVRREACVAALRAELDCEPDEAVATACPPLPEGMGAAARVRELERELRLLGPVNPLALEELRALEERHAFLEGQLEDVRSARRELNRVVRAVDEEIVREFLSAFEDVARHFADLFGTLFPGGSGRLLLTEPDDPLETGIEVEARPAGRNVRRLSLLSGGERSLAALAFLFAVFRSRPSPFYLLDEVEAALDDVNLHRFVRLLDEFRGEAQLIVVSHQKRTMEAADVLYGVTMQPGGVSKVVSERLRGRGAGEAHARRRSEGAPAADVRS